MNVISAASWLTAVLVAWLWASFVAPAALRAFGIPTVSGWQLVRRNRHLARPYYIWACGAFAFGLGLFWALTIRQEMCCLLTTRTLAQMTRTSFGLRLILCVGAGWVYGLLTAPQGEMSDLLFP